MNILRLLSLTRNYSSFKSIYSLENLYPKSSIKLYSPTFVPEDPNVKFTGYIPVDELTITYSRSSGPGGQHVNKTNTKVDLRFNVENATWISDEIKEKLLIQEKNRINKEGCLIIKSELTRLQSVNLADAMERLRVMIRKAVGPAPVTPSPESEEMTRKRLIKTARQRVFEKRIRSDVKKSRRMNNID